MFQAQKTEREELWGLCSWGKEHRLVLCEDQPLLSIFSCSFRAPAITAKASQEHAQSIWEIFFIIIFLKKNYRSRCMGLPRTKEGWEQRSTSRTQCLSVIFPRREQLHAPGSNHTLITEMYPTEILHPKTHPFSPKVIHKRHRDEHKEANLDSTSVAILLPSPQYLPLVYLLFLTWEKCCKTTGRYM